MGFLELDLRPAKLEHKTVGTVPTGAQNSVVDPKLLFSDPDRTFHFSGNFWSGSNSGSNLISQ